MSNGERAELRALQDLESVVTRVTEELTSFRRRAQRAEAARGEPGLDVDLVDASSRVRDLEDENNQLNGRLQLAGGKVRELLARLRFLEDQMTMESPPK